jgi:hypothetical protein
MTARRRPQGQESGRTRTSPTSHNRLVPEIQPDAVIAALASEPKLKAFVRNGRIETVPAKMSRRRELLDIVARAFEPGVRYPEPVVDDFLRKLHPDHAALRRYLVDEEFLDRAHGEYWRIGGTTHSS